MYYSLAYLAFLLTALSSIVCDVIGDPSESLVVLPTHDEPLATNHGDDEVVFRLILEDGCLRGEGYENPNFPAPAPVLLIWPSGYQSGADGDVVQVENTAGEIVAYSGAEVRFSGRFSSSESDLGRRLAADNPGLCSGHHFLVGDEVSVISPQEALVFRDPKTGLNFQRRESWRWMAGREFITESYYYGPVVLDDGCLLFPYTYKEEISEQEIIWPAGFYPHIGEDGLEVRNGGGMTIARPGEPILVKGGSISPRSPYGNSGCSERVFKINRIVDRGLPVAFLQHDADKSPDEVVWDGEDFLRRTYDDAFRNSHFIGKIEYRNGCMYIVRSILVWPKNFSIDESDGKFEILDGKGQVVAREGERAGFKVRIVSFSDEEGMSMLHNMPAGCDGGRFIFVGG